jgi:hypothetical protein
MAAAAVGTSFEKKSGKVPDFFVEQDPSGTLPPP